jgi:hypothetical protein
MEEVVLKIVKG